MVIKLCLDKQRVESDSRLEGSFSLSNMISILQFVVKLESKP